MLKNVRQLLKVRREVTGWRAFRNRALKMAREFSLDETVIAGFCDQNISGLEAKEREYLTTKENLNKSKLRNLIECPGVLTQARLAAGLSQTELARQLELKPQQIQRYERTDYRQISLTSIIKIAELLEQRLRDTV